MFVERFGRRRRLLRWAALFLGCACAGYIAAFVFAMAGAFQDPAGEPPPRLGEQERARGVSGLLPRDAPPPSADPRASR